MVSLLIYSVVSYMLQQPNTIALYAVHPNTNTRTSYIKTRIKKSLELHSHALAVVRRPNASDTGLSAQNRLVRPSQLLSAGISQQFHLLENFVWREVAHAYGFRPAVYVMADEDGMLARSRGNGKFDLWVGGCELGQQ